MTRGQIALFISRQLGLQPVRTDYYDDDQGSQYEVATNSVTAAGIGFGCGDRQYCPDQPLLREEMAELLVRTFSIAPSSTIGLLTTTGWHSRQPSMLSRKRTSLLDAIRPTRPPFAPRMR